MWFEANMTHNPLGSFSIITINFASLIERDPASVTEVPKTSVDVLQRFAATVLRITEVQDEPKSKQEGLGRLESVE
ncbi:hypothetical protein Hypma_014924 [Hypsizygus marmoreus]|uniref:Uncharacterized protein n=1 Tax=Hypsizygus marmoreus TaxID=39966 RepID=A0A369K4G8_HYPMA|nr:hypothetical protein Hypma_014924 [Hypsizygus marmoreus]